MIGPYECKTCKAIHQSDKKFGPPPDRCPDCKKAVNGARSTANNLKRNPKVAQDPKRATQSGPVTEPAGAIAPFQSGIALPDAYINLVSALDELERSMADIEATLSANKNSEPSRQLQRHFIATNRLLTAARVLTGRTFGDLDHAFKQRTKA